MTDETTRELLRRFRESLAVADEVAYLQSLLREGNTARERIRLAARLGHPAAREALGEDVDLLSHGWKREGPLEGFELELEARSLIALSRRAWSEYETRNLGQVHGYDSLEAAQLDLPEEDLVDTRPVLREPLSAALAACDQAVAEPAARGPLRETMIPAIQGAQALTVGHCDRALVGVVFAALIVALELPGPYEVYDGLLENWFETVEKGLFMKHLSPEGWVEVPTDADERRGRFAPAAPDTPLADYEVRAALCAELGPWLLGHGDPLRERLVAEA